MREIFFKSSLHKERFLKAMQETDKIYDGKLDQEYSAALIILTADLFMWNKTRSYVDSQFIGIEEILHEVDLSGGQGVLVTLAGNLFNNQQHLDPLELLRLDGSNYNVAIAALHLRRDSYHVDDFKGEQ